MKLSMPKTTRLYVVQPLALGTIETESLTSYVRRLAAAHVVSPSALLRLEVLEPHRRSAGQRHQAMAPVLCTEGINGARRSTRILVDALEELTGVSRVRETSLLDRDRAVCFDGAFRDFRAWCPECLADGSPYDRLLWSFSAIKTCVRHERPLEDRCPRPRCGKPHRPWHRAASPDGCPFCSEQLDRLATGGSQPEPAANERVLRDLLALLLTGSAVTPDMVARGVIALLDGRTWTEVALMTGVSRTTLCGIRRQSLRPNIDVLLRLVVASDESLAHFLAQPARRIVTRRLPAVKGGTPPPRRVLADSPDLLERALWDALARPDGQIPSARRFAREHATTADALRRRWPDAVTALGRAFREQEHRRRAVREAHEVALVRDAVSCARRTGEASRRTVEELLGRPALFRQPHVRRAYLDALGGELREVRDAA